MWYSFVNSDGCRIGCPRSQPRTSRLESTRQIDEQEMLDSLVCHPEQCTRVAAPAQDESIGVLLQICAVLAQDVLDRASREAHVEKCVGVCRDLAREQVVQRGVEERGVVDGEMRDLIRLRGDAVLRACHGGRHRVQGGGRQYWTVDDALTSTRFTRIQT